MHQTTIGALSLGVALFLGACQPAEKTPDTPKTEAANVAKETPKETPKEVTPEPAKTPEAAAPRKAPEPFETSAGKLVLTPITHGTALLEIGGKAIYIDPWSKGSFAGLPKADFILITDIHQDHLDPAAIDLIKQEKTVIWGPQAVADKLPGTVVIKNGEKKTWESVEVEAIPMYNNTRGPEPGKLFHDKGRGNGYVLSVGGKRLYFSGDTECTTEMKALKNIDAAFVSMNLPYTMPPSEAAECVKAFRPKTLYPYHYRGSDLGELDKTLAGESGIAIKKLEWY